MSTKIKPKKPQLVASHRDKLAKKYSSVNRRGEPSFIEVVFSMAILVGVIALIWYLL
jgi:hypothetical protein